MGRPRTLRETASKARGLWYGALITGAVTGAITFGVAADLYHAHRRAVRARRPVMKGAPPA